MLASLPITRRTAGTLVYFENDKFTIEDIIMKFNDNYVRHGNGYMNTETGVFVPHCHSGHIAKEHMRQRGIELGLSHSREVAVLFPNGLISYYSSGRVCSEKLGISYGAVNRALNNKYAKKGYIVKGMQFFYVNPVSETSEVDDES